MQSEIDEPDIPGGIAVFGSDDTAGEGSMLYFDEREVSRRYDWKLKDGMLRWSRTNHEFSQYCELTIAADGQTMSSRGEYSCDGGSWETDLALAFTRAR